MIGAAERPNGRPDQAHDLAQLFLARLVDGTHVAGEGGHDMAGGVGVLVEDEESLGGPEQNEGAAIVPACQRLTEDAATCRRRCCRPGGRYVRHPPRRPVAAWI